MSAVLCATLIASATPARAQLPDGSGAAHVRAELRLMGPQGCPDERTVAAAVEALLEREVFDSDDPDVRIIGELSRMREGWGAVLRLERVDGEVVGTRELVSEEAGCRALMASLPLVLALMVDLPKTHVSLRVPAPPPATEPPAPPPPATEPPAPLLPPPEPPATEPPPPAAPSEPAFDAELGAVTAFGWLPGVPVGALAGLGIERGRLRIGLRGYLHPPWTEGVARGEVRTWAAGGGLRGAAVLVAGARAALDGFVELAVGRFEARSVGVRQPLTARGPTVDSLGGLDVRLRLGGPWSLGLELGLGVPLAPPRFTVQVGDARVEVFSAPPMYGRVALWIGLSTGDL